MKRKFSYMALLGLLFPMVAAGPGTGVDVLVYKGIARDLHSNRFYYVEEHREIRENDELKETLIRYKDSSNKLIAQKVIDYTQNKVSPSFEQNDYRDGYTEAVVANASQLVLKYRKNNSEVLKTKTVKRPSNLVVDGGFNYYIKAHWETLLSRKTLVFNFAVPSQLDYFAFRLYKEAQGEEGVVFRMEPDNFVLRQLVDPIRVTYRSDTKRIVRYEGLSNINDRKGKSYLVRIQYPKVGP